MLHPAFLSAGSEWAEASFQTPAGTSSCCLPPETDAGAAAAPRSKRRRHGPGGISKEAKQQQQAFTKRKRTIMDKAFEMSQAADAKVFCFFISQEGNAFAYASPNFQAALDQPHLDALKQSGGCGAWERVRVMTQPGREDIVHSPELVQDQQQQQCWGTAGGGDVICQTS